MGHEQEPPAESAACEVAHGHGEAISGDKTLIAAFEADPTATNIVLPFAENCNQIYLAGLSAGDLAVLRRGLATIYDNVQRVRAENGPRRIARRRGTAA